MSGSARKEKPFAERQTCAAGDPDQTKARFPERAQRPRAFPLTSDLRGCRSSRRTDLELYRGITAGFSSPCNFPMPYSLHPIRVPCEPSRAKFTEGWLTGI